MPPNILHQINILTSNYLLNENENKNLLEDDQDGNIDGKNTSGARYGVFNDGNIDRKNTSGARNAVFNSDDPGRNSEFNISLYFLKSNTNIARPCA